VAHKGRDDISMSIMIWVTVDWICDEKSVSRPPIGLDMDRRLTSIQSLSI
jgi:hypothetical protein